MKHAIARRAGRRWSRCWRRCAALPGLKEKSRGVFYRKGRAFLHFHEDPKGLFADVRDAAGRDFDRIDVTEEPGRRALMAAATARLA